MADENKHMLNTYESIWEDALEDIPVNDLNDDELEKIIGDVFNSMRLKWKAEVSKKLTDNAPKMLKEHREILEGFEKRNFIRWRDAFNQFEQLIVMITEVSEANDQELRKKAIKTQDFKFEALASITTKALLITREIHCLLKGGFPDAALARWRTLYELSVVSQFLTQNDNNIALRYIASYHFHSLRAAKELNSHSDRGSLMPFAAEEIEELEKKALDVESQLGCRLKKDYDWAWPVLAVNAPNLKPDRVSFSEIEKNVGMDHWRPRYRWANQHVHSGYRPPDKLLGMAESEKLLALVGPSNSGFVDPFQMTSISLVHIITNFLLLKPNIDRIIMIDILTDLRDEIAQTAIKLEQETLKEHKNSMVD